MTGLKVVEVNVHVQGVNADTTLDKDNSESKEGKQKKDVYKRQLLHHLISRILQK